MRTRDGARLGSVLAGVALLAAPAAAHVGGLGGGSAAGPVPTWLTVLTGGAVIGASFLFASVVTDHDDIRAVNDGRVGLPTTDALRTAAARIGRAVSLVVLALVVVTGLTGPRTATASFAILVVWAGWWAGYTMTVYLVGNSWPALNPWRALATALPGDGPRSLPERLGVWPSVVGLLALVWIEVVSPLAEAPRLLAALVVGYTAVTLAGAAVYGTGSWFGTVDPVARVFRVYGRVAPVGRGDDGLELRLPGSALATRGPPEGPDETPFVVALLWVTTFDGAVATPTWRALADPLVAAGVPALAVYLLAIVGGYAAFLGVYRAASRRVPDAAGSYVTPAAVRRRFVPSLVPIAAGYHAAHFLGYFLTLSPALAAAVASPLVPSATPEVAVLPAWFGVVGLGFVLLGHALAVWVSHGVAFDLFPGRLAPIRAQYPLVVVMVAYTMTSLWIVAQPYAPPPYV